jgi:hypothetical protein
VEAQRQMGVLDSVSRAFQHAGGNDYAALVRAYVDLLKEKLRFHRDHPAFTGTFDYEDYVAQKGVTDPNEGYSRRSRVYMSVIETESAAINRYQTIVELSSLQDLVDRFQKRVFQSLRHGHQNECRISSLVPLVQESYGIYNFLLAMLMAMHNSTFFCLVTVGIARNTKKEP